MTARSKRTVALICCGLSICSCIALGDDDDAAPTGAQSVTPTLNGEQLRAVGIVVARPLAARAPSRIDALGVVLDATTLIADLGEAAATAAAEQAASAELTRLHSLYSGGGGASLRALETAQAEQAKSRAQADTARARVTLHWGPLSTLSSAARQKIIDAAASGRTLLLRADVPGRHTVGALHDRALVDVDGVQLPGTVLGPLSDSTELQSAGLLIDVPNAPAGLGPGARLPVALLSEERSGRVLPRGAVLYDEKGAYVYKQLSRKAGEDKTRYASMKVKLLMPYGDGWLADGIDDDDDIVVHGAGVLWSLQGVGTRAADDDD